MGTAKTVNTQGTPDEKYCPMCDYYQDGRASLGDSFFQGRIKPPAHTCSLVERFYRRLLLEGTFVFGVPRRVAKSVKRSLDLRNCCGACEYWQDIEQDEKHGQFRVARPPPHTCSTGQTAEQKAYTDSQQDYLAKLYKADRTGRLDTVTTPLGDGAVRVELVNDLDGLLDF